MILHKAFKIHMEMFGPAGVDSLIDPGIMNISKIVSMMSIVSGTIVKVTTIVVVRIVTHVIHLIH